MHKRKKSDEEVSKELQEIRRSTRKLAKFIPGQDTGTATQTNNRSPSKVKFILTLNVNKTNLNLHRNPYIHQNMNLYIV